MKRIHLQTLSLSLSLAVLASSGGIARAQLSESELDSPSRSRSRTRGHAQVGLALFDRVGTLADEHEARGFSPFGGGTLRLGFVHYIDIAPWLGFGGSVRGTFGNASSGDQEYFLNPIFTSGTVAAFLAAGPRSSGFNVAVDVGMTNVLAKNRRPNGSGGTSIFHEYGIGLGVGLLVGYRLDLGVATAVTLSAQHSRHWVGVEEDGGSSKTWPLGVTSFLLGIEL